jgi:hypothetical protein
MKSWLGCQSSELVAKWGPPQNVMRDKNGEIWTYFYQRQWTAPGSSYTTTTGRSQTYGDYHPSGIFGPAHYSGDTTSQANSVTTYSPPQTHAYDCRRTFFINEQGTIYRYAWQGL